MRFLPTVEQFITSSTVHNFQEYLNATGMNVPGTWGTQLEVHGLAAMLNTAVYVYTPDRHNWVRFSPEVVDARLVNSITDKGLYIQNLDEQHFNVVLSTQPPNAAHGVVREGIVQGN